MCWRLQMIPTFISFDAVRHFFWIVHRVATVVFMETRMDRLRHNCFTGFTAKAVSPSQRFIQRIVPVVFLFSFFSVGLREVPAQKIRNTPDQQIADAANAEESEEPVEEGIFLPNDRMAERRLDRAERLVEEQRWSDASTLFDDILSADNDSFFKPDATRDTWLSMKTETTRLIGAMPAAGRESYQLQFRARAQRMLSEAIASANSDQIIAVARRWFHTPAGYRATLFAAIENLESGQPLAALAWLDRLAAVGEESLEFEPTLSIMRSLAAHRAGDDTLAISLLDATRKGSRLTARIGGRDVSVSYPPDGAMAWLANIAGPKSASANNQPGEWLVHRGNPARNAMSAGGRPLLVSRWRVPTTRHPEEARLLEKSREHAADRQDIPLLPASHPLAVAGTVLMHTPMGLLAVDFETGKRIWWVPSPRQSPSAVSETDTDNVMGAMDVMADAQRQRAIEAVFDDATSGTLASDGRLVFAVESSPRAIAMQNNGMPIRVAQNGESWQSGNRLSAYDIANGGKLRWRRPSSGSELAERKTPPEREDPPAGPLGVAAPMALWHCGTPLPLGDQISVLVEERGQIRLDVLEAATGKPLWSQPLAEVDESRSIDNPNSRGRRTAGLSPSMAEGVLVCPTAAGAVVGVDVATRTLLWAYHYPISTTEERIAQGIGIGGRRPQNVVVFNGQVVPPGAEHRWIDSVPTLASGYSVLTPSESNELHCVSLRRGTLSWKLPRKENLYVAGIVENMVVLVGRRSVEAVSLAEGKSIWKEPISWGDAGMPSGRGFITGSHLFVPLDTPEIVDIDLKTGTIVGRSPARGNHVPGNLIAYRGEILSQGVDSLDAFYQESLLQKRIETVQRDEPRDLWATTWQGQLSLSAGHIQKGILQLESAGKLDSSRVTRDMLADAFQFALQRDFAASSERWRDAIQLAGDGRVARDMLRTTVDGFLKTKNISSAWEASRELIGRSTSREDEESLVFELPTRRSSCRESRWLQGRFADLLKSAESPLLTTINGFASESLETALASTTTESLEWFLDCFASHPLAEQARNELLTRLTQRGNAGDTFLASDPAADPEVRRELILLSMLASTDAASRSRASDLLGLSKVFPTEMLPSAWPLGAVEQTQKNRRPQDNAQQHHGFRVIPIPIDGDRGPFMPSLQMGFDLQQQSLIATDGMGRQIGAPLRLDDRNSMGGMMIMPHAAEASVVGRIVVVRSGLQTSAIELADRPGGKNRVLWRSPDDGSAVLRNQMFGVFNANGVGQRIRRNHQPLGMRIVEPDIDATQVATVQGGQATIAGVPMLSHRTLEVRDIRTGRIIWERHRLPVDGELVGDDTFITVCPKNGLGAVVLSMVDGRIVRTCDVPRIHQRLGSSGHRLVVITGSDKRPADRAGIELFDPVTLERISLGEFSGESRVTPVGPHKLSVLEPTGQFTLLDLVRGKNIFSIQLPGMPSTLQQVHVMPWENRLLVIVGRQETPEEQKMLAAAGQIQNLPWHGHGEPNPMITGSIWSIDATTGRSLWQVPATIQRHGLLLSQPSDVPLLFFARQIIPSVGGEKPRMSVLCLDKRTGHEVFLEDKIAAEHQMLFNCSMTGDPENHSIALELAGRSYLLRYRGQPMAPQPPYQASIPAAGKNDPSSNIGRWLQDTMGLRFDFFFEPFPDQK